MRRSALLVFAVVFLGALALYVSTAAPSLTWAHDGADGGDLITAAATNGVAHPPGYPTYVTLGQVIAHVPIGDVAYRFNLFSALCMASAAGFTALSIWRLMPAFRSTAIVACPQTIGAVTKNKLAIIALERKAGINRQMPNAVNPAASAMHSAEKRLKRYATSPMGTCAIT